MSYKANYWHSEAVEKSQKCIQGTKFALVLAAYEQLTHYDAMQAKFEVSVRPCIYTHLYVN